MNKTRTLAMVALGLVLSTHSLQSQDRSRYRDFQLGGDLPSISALTGVAASEAKTIHLRPAIMKELQWQRPYSVSGMTPANFAFQSEEGNNGRKQQAYVTGRFTSEPLRLETTRRLPRCRNIELGLRPIQ